MVQSDDFNLHEQTKIEVSVPLDAQTGPVTVSNGEADPILVVSENNLEVALPNVTGIAPDPVKAGTALTLSGTDLDLINSITFNGGVKVEDFTSVTAQSLVLQVPANAQDGALRVGVASLVEVETAQQVVLVVPSIASMSPNPAKNGQPVTISGTDLDLVTTVTFGGGKVGTVTSASGNELIVTVPQDAAEAVVTLATAANKSVVSANVLTLVAPVITGMTPTEVKTNNPVTFTGTNLDLIASVIFTGTTGDLSVNSERSRSLTPALS
jgi:hypothetical protein